MNVGAGHGRRPPERRRRVRRHALRRGQDRATTPPATRRWPCSSAGPAGTWDPLYGIDEAGTRPIILLNEAAAELLFVYMSVESSGNIVYRTSPTSSISFSDKSTLISGGLAEPTSTKQNYADDLVILATSGSNAVGRHCTLRPATSLRSRSNDSYSTPSRTRPSTVAAPGVLANDTDVDPLTAIKVSDPAHGTVTAFNANGAFTYTPTTGYTGSDTFTYKANDGTADSNIATVTSRRR